MKNTVIFIKQSSLFSRSFNRTSGVSSKKSLCPFNPDIKENKTFQSSIYYPITGSYNGPSLDDNIIQLETSVTYEDPDLTCDIDTNIRGMVGGKCREPKPCTIDLWRDYGLIYCGESDCNESSCLKIHPLNQFDPTQIYPPSDEIVQIKAIVNSRNFATLTILKDNILRSMPYLGNKNPCSEENIFLGDLNYTENSLVSAPGGWESIARCHKVGDQQCTGLAACDILVGANITVNNLLCLLKQNNSNWLIISSIFGFGWGWNENLPNDLDIILDDPTQANQLAERDGDCSILYNRLCCAEPRSQPYSGLLTYQDLGPSLKLNIGHNQFNDDINNSCEPPTCDNCSFYDIQDTINLLYPPDDIDPDQPMLETRLDIDNAMLLAKFGCAVDKRYVCKASSSWPVQSVSENSCFQLDSSATGYCSLLLHIIKYAQDNGDFNGWLDGFVRNQLVDIANKYTFETPEDCENHCGTDLSSSSSSSNSTNLSSSSSSSSTNSSSSSSSSSNNYPSIVFACGFGLENANGSYTLTGEENNAGLYVNEGTNATLFKSISNEAWSITLSNGISGEIVYFSLDNSSVFSNIWLAIVEGSEPPGLTQQNPCS